MLGTMSPEKGVKTSALVFNDPTRTPSRPSSFRTNVYLSDEGEDSGESKHYSNTSECYSRRKAKCLKRKSSKRASASRMAKSLSTETDDSDDDSDQSEEELEDGVSRCSFGRISKRKTTKNLSVRNLVAPRRECRCSATVTEHDDFVCGWESKYQTGKYYRPVRASKARKTQNHIPHAYQRLLPERDTRFDFHHYDNLSNYMEQYRQNHTVGDVCKMRYYHMDDVIISEPPVPKSKSNACPIAETCDFLAILSMDNENGDTDHPTYHTNASMGLPHFHHDLHSVSDDENNEDIEKNLSVHDRGKKLNLAPVRKPTTSRPRLCKSTVKIAPKKTSRSTQSQYLNLVIPKTTLHRKDLQLNVQPVKDTYSSRFDTRRLSSGPNKNAFRRTGSADSLHSQQNLTGGENSPLHRPVEVRKSRSNTFHINSAPVPGSAHTSTVPSSSGTSPASLSPAKGAKHNKGCERINALLPCFPNDMYNKLHTNNAFSSNTMSSVYHTTNPRPQPQKVWEGGDRISSDRVKNDTVIPVPVGSFGVRGRTCNSDDRVTIGYRLKRDRERRLGLSAVT